MIERKEFLNYVEKMIEFCKKYEMKTLLADNEKLVKDINDFVVHILLMGSFSAGKSALLNSVLGKEILPVDQGEVTAIATELWYDNNEYVEAVSANGIDIYSIDKIEDIPSEDYDYIRVHVDSDFLGKIPSVRLVDMPGLDSKVERHNKAIMQYVGCGNAYLLCIDCEDGVLKSSRAEFVKEVKQYKNSLVLAVTKCDKKTDGQVQKIADAMQYSTEEAFQEKVKTFTVSRYDEDIEEKMLQIVGAFDLQSLFEQAFSIRITENMKLYIKALIDIKNAEQYDGDNIDNEIEKIQNSKIELEKKLRQEEDRLEKKIICEVKPNILGDIEVQLNNNISKLTSAAMASPESFSRTINSIIRPVLLTATQQYAEESFAEFIEEIGIQKFSGDFADVISERYELFSKKWGTALEMGKREDGTYKAVFGALAALTDIVAPWVEVVIIFLPEIIGLFSGVLQKNQENVIRTKMQFEIIPQILDKIEGEINKTLAQIKEEMLENITMKYQMECQAKVEAIQKLQCKKEKEQLEYEDLIGGLNDDIESAIELMNEFNGKE